DSVELGVRSALGAATQRLALLVIGRGVRAVVAGTLIGVAISLALGSRVAALLFQTCPRDPGAFVGVAGCVTVLCWSYGGLCCGSSRLPRRWCRPFAPRASIRWKRCAARCSYRIPAF